MSNNRPRVLLCSIEFSPGPGGIATHVHQLALHLVQTGWDVRVLTPQEHATDAEVEAFNRAQPYVVVRQHGPRGGLSGLPARLRGMRAALAGWRPDVVVGCGQRAVWYGIILARLLRKPFVAIGYGSEFLRTQTLRGKVTHVAFMRADAVVVISEYTRRLMEAAGIRPANVWVIPPGANGTEFRPDIDVTDLRQRLGLGDGRVLLTVGVVKERKGQDLVIRALPEILKEFPDTVYLMAGRPNSQREFSALAQSLGVEEYVRFLGPVPQEDLPALYNLCDVFVIASRELRRGEAEGYGIAVIEAALCGKPAVVTRDCGLEETIGDGETGLLVNQGDFGGIAAAVRRLFRDEALRERMGQAAERTVRAQGTWAHRVQEFDHVLRSMSRRPITVNTGTVSNVPDAADRGQEASDSLSSD